MSASLHRDLVDWYPLRVCGLGMRGVRRPPAERKASFDADYPSMGRVPDVQAAIERGGLSLIEHFTIPDRAWWDDFYTPMESQIQEMRRKYAGDEEAVAVLDQLARETDMHRKYSRCYGYEFFIARKI